MRQLFSIFFRLGRACEGATAVVWALTLPIIIGAIGLGADVGSWYSAKRGLQNAVDAAAVAAAHDITGSNPQQTTMYYTAVGEMSRNGFEIVDDDVTLTVNYPPTSGAHAGNNRSVEVSATQPQARFLSRMFLGSDPDTQVRAVANRQMSGSACVLALNNSTSSALLFQGSTTVNLTNCSAASNSHSSTAIDVSGSSTLNTYSLYSVGGYSVGGSATLTTTEESVTQGAQLDDPYSGVNVPSYSGCDQNNFSRNNTATITPGVYCNGMSFGSKAVITMQPGTYIIDRGDFDVKGGAQITGTGVTIILTSSTGSNYGNAKVAGGSTVSLSAPTSGTYTGMLMYQDRNAPPATNQNKLVGGSTTSYVGALYFPKQELQFAGNNSSSSGSCTKIVADTITFIGNSYMNNTCPDSVATINTQGIVTLVE